MVTVKSYTDLPQSKKLAEILPLESADNVIVSFGSREGTKTVVMPKETFDIFRTPFADIRETTMCWSLSALLDLLPSEFTEKGKYSETTYSIDIRKYALTEDVDVYQIAYGNYKFYEDGHSSWKDMINTGEKEDLIDAAFQMIIWLKENNKL